MSDPTPPDDGFEFTNDWFKPARRQEWESLFALLSAERLLEIGSYEGASACFLIGHLGARHPIELHCVDTWAGGVEHREAGLDMEAVEARFDRNVARAIAAAPHPTHFVKHKGPSLHELSRMVADGRSGTFDFVFVDGSHTAPDVLADAVLGFELLKVGGVIVFDDYLWAESLPYGLDPLRCPKPAVDAFANINFRRCRQMRAPLYQAFFRKVAS